MRALSSKNRFERNTFEFRNSSKGLKMRGSIPFFGVLSEEQWKGLELELELEFN